MTDLARRAETTRSDLAHMLDAHHNRITPAAIRSDMRGYARDTRQHMMQTVEAKIRENPLEAAAIAVGLADPLWRPRAAPLAKPPAARSPRRRHRGAPWH